MPELEILSNWWLPNDNTNKIPGILRFKEPDWPSLELLGAFEPSIFYDRMSYKIIHGLSQDGKPITLCNCEVTNINWSSSGTSQAKYLVHFVLIGHHFSDVDDIEFSEADLEFSHLFDWIGRSAVEQQFSSDAFGLSHTLPNPIEFPADFGKYSCKFGGSTHHELGLHSIRERRFINIKADTSKHIDSFISEYIRPFQHFLSLGTQKPAFIRRFNFLVSEENSVEVYLRQHSLPVNYAEKRIKGHKMLFTLSDVFERKERILRKWSRNRDKTLEVRRLIYDTINTGDLFLHHRFLNTIQAIETYHSRVFKSEILEPTKHKARKKNIVDSCPREHAEWLKARLANSNSKTLSMRLNDLMRRYKSSLSPIIADFDWFNKKIRDTRNYYTHYNKEFRDKALKDEALLWNTERLSVLANACLLKELGFNRDEIKNLFEKAEFYKHLILIKNVYAGTDPKS